MIMAIVQECQGLPLALVEDGRALRDHDIKIEHLARYGMGKQLFIDVDKIDEARSRAHLRVGELKASDGLNCPKLQILLGENEGFELIPDGFE
ncbi:hypothetical protein HAX54_021852 [Datura stramonium]|uniref:Uncharacterized protein n=1 Tax=Datura stramonium TaxID=4076 RepID=A0ABS8UTC1_DATST|nr:hypothetical protein [Datura stramonium]